MRLYTLLAKLLDYPDPVLQQSLPEIWEVVHELPSRERHTLSTFLVDAELRWHDLIEWQSRYVATFDMVPDHALHLTHHLFGEEKNRGPALIDLSEFYKSYGLELAANELPDYLPLMLEFTSQLDEEEARFFWNKWLKVLNQLASNLEQSESPYAPLIRLVQQRGQLAQAA